MTMESMEYGIPVEEQMTQQPGGLPETAEPGLVPESPDHPPREDAEAGGTPEPGTNEGEVLEAAPKKKRAAKKKTEKVEGAAPEGGGALEASDGQAPLETPDNGGAPPPLPETVPSDGELPEADRLDPEAGSAGSGDMVVVGLTDQEGDDLPDGELPAGEEALLPGETALPPEQPSPPEEAPRTVAPRPRAGRPAEGHSPLLSLKLNELDRNLTEQERQEWNDIYASFRSKSVLTGRIIGVDAHAFHVHNRESGQVERKRMYCAAVISLRVKVLIPETEMWMPGEERPTHVLRNMSGAEIDYVILDVDRENNMAIASRRMGAMIRQRAFDTARGGHQPGERMTCRILTVGPSRCLVECGGRDLTLRYQDISYSSFSDLREKYHRDKTGIYRGGCARRSEWYWKQDQLPRAERIEQFVSLFRESDQSSARLWAEKHMPAPPVRRETAAEFFNAVVELVKSNGFWPDQSAFITCEPARPDVALCHPMFDFCPVLTAENGGGLRIDCYLNGIFDHAGNSKRLAGTIQTACSDRDTCVLMGSLTGALLHYGGAHREANMDRYVPLHNHDVKKEI